MTALMDTPRVGTRNAAKKTTATSVAPWRSWHGSRAGLVIRFLQEQIIVPRGHGAGEPMALLPFQTSWIEEAFADGVRSAALSIPRGNGKTGLLAGVGLAELHLNEWSPEVPLVATTVGQVTRASGVFGTMRRMTQLNPEMESRSLVYRSPSSTMILVPETDGSAFPVSSRDEGNMQGLNPSLAIADELAHLDITAWSSLTSAGGKRPESLVAGISTPSDDKTSALYELRVAAMEGRDMPGFRFTEYAAEDGCEAGDRAQWRKANPALGFFLAEDALVTDLATLPEAIFRIRRLGQWVEGLIACWLGERARELWDRGAISDGLVPGKATWAAVDMSLRNDCSAVVAGQFGEDERLHVKAWILQPEGGTIDPRDAMEVVRDLHRDFDLRQVSYDSRYFELPARELTDEGVAMVEVPQTDQRMTPAVMGLHEAISAGNVAHDGDPMLRAHILNAVPHLTEHGFTLSKRRSTAKIDAAVALAMTHRAAVAADAPVTDSMLLGGIR